jgi:hypothetical protein
VQSFVGQARKVQTTMPFSVQLQVLQPSLDAKLSPAL